MYGYSLHDARPVSREILVQMTRNVFKRSWWKSDLSKENKRGHAHMLKRPKIMLFLAPQGISVGKGFDGLV